jgi:hypothetical protein
MTEPAHKQTSPALAFLKKNAAVASLAGALVIGVGVYAVNAAQPERTATPGPVPSINSTASLAGGPMVAATATASPGASGAPSAAAGASGGTQAGAVTTGGSAGQPSGVTTTTAAAAERPQTTVTVGTAAQAPPIQDWRPVAAAFSKAWANPSVGKDAWLAAMKPYVTSDVLTEFSRTDIRNVPQDTLQSIHDVKQVERTHLFDPVYASGKDRFGASIAVQTDGSWLVDHVGATE